MISGTLDEAFTTLALAQAQDNTLGARLLAFWERQAPELASELPQATLLAAQTLDRELVSLLETAQPKVVAELWNEQRAELLIDWCAGSVARGNVRMVPLLRHIQKTPRFAERVQAIARDRIVQGPLVDALSSAPLL